MRVSDTSVRVQYDRLYRWSERMASISGAAVACALAACAVDAFRCGGLNVFKLF